MTNKALKVEQIPAERKRADQLRVGDVAKFGVHIARIVEIIRESPQVFLIHIAHERHNGLPWVYRKRANTMVETFKKDAQ